MFDLDSAFAPWVIGEDAYERVGAAKELRGKPRFSLLEHIGFTRAQIEEAQNVIIGRMTIEGAPHLREEHYAVFDCANRCGKHGQRFLAPMSHVRMMAAVQPFLSGAISKTVNLPNEATVEEVQSIYEEGWRLGLKAVALYRDGCKASQPLSSGSTEDRTAKKEESTIKPDPLLAPLPQGTAETGQPQLTLRMGNTPASTASARLPKKRHGFTQEARVGGHKIFLRTGEYEDGTLGEIFIDMHKEGAAFRSLMNCFAMSVSIGPQYGVPLQTYVDQYTYAPLRAAGPGRGTPSREVRDVDRRLHLPRSRRRVPAPLRARAHQARGRRDAARRGPQPRHAARAAEPALAAAHGHGEHRHRSPPTVDAPRKDTPPPCPTPARRRGSQRRHDRYPRRHHRLPPRRAARHDDGRRARVRRLRSHHRAQRRLLQVPELRKFDGRCCSTRVL